MVLYLLSQLYPATLPHGRLGPGTNPKVPSVHHPASFAPFCPGRGSHPSRAHSCNPATPVLPITSLQPSQFHAVTHSFAQQRTAISPILNTFHTLSIATGVVPHCMGKYLNVYFNLGHNSPGSCGQTIRRVSGLQYTLRPGNSHLRAFKRTPWINA